MTLSLGQFPGALGSLLWLLHVAAMEHPGGRWEQTLATQSV